MLTLKSMAPPIQEPPEAEPGLLRTDLMLEGGGTRPISRAELERLEAAGDQKTLERVVFEYSNGRRVRPYRFTSVGPVEFDGTTVVI